MQTSKCKVDFLSKHFPDNIFFYSICFEINHSKVACDEYMKHILISFFKNCAHPKTTGGLFHLYFQERTVQLETFKIRLLKETLVLLSPFHSLDSRK